MSKLFGSPGNDSIKGTKGNDVIFGFAGDDFLHGNAGNNIIHGGQGDDEIHGGDDASVLFGDAGDDYLRGGTGNDRLFGGEGNDTLIGGPGSDRLRGGLGDDVYIYSPGDGFDIIADNAGINTLWLKQIYADEVQILRRFNNCFMVIYKDEPIIHMEGIHYIRTETGCFELNAWLNTEKTFN